MLQHAYFLAKIGADTAENEQHVAEICQKLATTLRVPAAAGWTARGRTSNKRSTRAGRDRIERLAEGGVQREGPVRAEGAARAQVHGPDFRGTSPPALPSDLSALALVVSFARNHKKSNYF